MIRWFLIASTLLFAAGGIFAAWDWYRLLPVAGPPAYVGSQACAQCHRAEYDKWRGSHHEQAMQPATAQTVLGDFNNVTFEHFGVTSRFRRAGDKFLVETEGPAGQPVEYTVSYTFGVAPLQQYLVDFADGRKQVLPLCWDTVRKRWFHIYPDEPIRPGDPLHWTGYAQTWNHMCADCHSTDLRRGFDPAENKYHTTFAEVSVGCEGCHGPGGDHIRLATEKTLFWDRERGKGLTVTLKDPSNRVQVDTCSQCHALNGTLAAEQQPGHAPADHKLLQLIDGVQYFDDGQIQGETYEYGSFLQSKMFHKNIKCSDCHDPHTAKLKFQGNQLCTSCHQHPAAKYDSPAHHRHQVGSSGAQCVECHMPHRTYMVVHPRRDHSLRVPRPDLSVKLGTPNACNQCHDRLKTPDLSGRDTVARAQWAADAVREWHGPAPATTEHYGEILQAARLNKADSLPRLIALAGNREVPAIARASAVSWLGNYTEPAQQAAIQTAAVTALDDPEAIVRRAATEQLDAVQLTNHGLRLLRDPTRLVRHSAARRLAQLPAENLSAELPPVVSAVLADYEQCQQALRDTPDANLNLAALAANRGDYEQADQMLQLAQRLFPAAWITVLQRAEVLNLAGNNAQAEKVLRAGIQRSDELLAQWERDDPLVTDAETRTRRRDDRTREQQGGAELRAGLAKLLIEMAPNKTAEALALLRAALAAYPELPRGNYNLGLLERQAGDLPAAERNLRRAVELDPQNVDALRVLAALQQERGDVSGAEATLLAAMKANPTARLELTIDLADFYLAQQRPERAEALLQPWLDRRPPPELIERLIRALTAQGRNAEVEQLRPRLSPRPPR